MYSSISLYAAMAGAAFAFQACLSSPLSSFHFTEMSAFRVELLMPGRSSSSCFLASLLKIAEIKVIQHTNGIVLQQSVPQLEFVLNLKRRKEEAGLLGRLGSALSCFFFWRCSLVFCSIISVKVRMVCMQLIFLRKFWSVDRQVDVQDTLMILSVFSFFLSNWRASCFMIFICSSSSFSRLAAS